jgi:hypothetical protein
MTKDRRYVSNGILMGSKVMEANGICLDHLHRKDMNTFSNTTVQDDGQNVTVDMEDFPSHIILGSRMGTFTIWKAN